MSKFLPLAVLLLSGCAVANTDWQASRYYDDFTNTSSCRVLKGSQSNRDFTRGFSGALATLQFYAENINGEIRAGVINEPLIPITGDVQIKTANKFYTLTVKDAPLDTKLSTPEIPSNGAMTKELADAMKSVTENVQGIASPYRAYRGAKAKTLLKDIVSSDSEVKFRMVGVNTALSNTGSFVADDKFIAALKECNISY